MNSISTAFRHATDSLAPELSHFRVNSFQIDPALNVITYKNAKVKKV